MVNRGNKRTRYFSYTNNPVPLTILSEMSNITPKAGTNLLKVGTGINAKTTGLLADVAPTCLGLIGLNTP